jgi:hypothetical protein
VYERVTALSSVPDTEVSPPAAVFFQVVKFAVVEAAMYSQADVAVL